MVQDTITYDAIGRDTGDATPLGQINTAYLGETGQVSTVTAHGQSILAKLAPDLARFF